MICHVIVYVMEICDYAFYTKNTINLYFHGLNNFRIFTLNTHNSKHLLPSYGNSVPPRKSNSPYLHFCLGIEKKRKIFE